MLKKFLYVVIAAILFSGCQNISPENSKEIELLYQLLNENPKAISNLSGVISKEECEVAGQLIHDYLLANLKKEYQIILNNIVFK